MVGIKEKKPLFPVMGFVAALASFLFVLVLAGDLLGTFTTSTKQVAMQAAPMLETAAPTPGLVEAEEAQSEISNSPTPAETQVGEAQALKAIPPAADETGANPSDALPSASLGAVQEPGVTATPTIGEMYAKEAPAPGVIPPGETNTPEGINATGEIESRSQLMASSTSEAFQPQETTVTETPLALFQNAGLAAESTQEKELPNTSGRQGPQSVLRVLEVFLAMTSLIASALYFFKRHKTVQ